MQYYIERKRERCILLQRKKERQYYRERERDGIIEKERKIVLQRKRERDSIIEKERDSIIEKKKELVFLRKKERQHYRERKSMEREIEIQRKTIFDGKMTFFYCCDLKTQF